MGCFCPLVNLTGKLQPANKTNMLVKYIKPYAPYAIDDVRNVENSEAKELEAAGVVKFLDKPAKDKMIKSPTKAKRAYKRRGGF